MQYAIVALLTCAFSQISTAGAHIKTQFETHENNADLDAPFFLLSNTSSVLRSIVFFHRQNAIPFQLSAQLSLFLHHNVVSNVRSHPLVFCTTIPRRNTVRKRTSPNSYYCIGLVPTIDTRTGRSNSCGVVHPVVVLDQIRVRRIRRKHGAWYHHLGRPLAVLHRACAVVQAVVAADKGPSAFHPVCDPAVQHTLAVLKRRREQARVKAALPTNGRTQRSGPALRDDSFWFG